MRIEDYGLIGNLRTAALIGRDGSIDWLCLPRFDSDACFAALLGDERHGRWLLAPAGGVRRVTRRYRPGTLILETEFECDEGTVRVVDCMPPGAGPESVVRLVEGVRGSVPMRMQLVIRLNYGLTIPWVTNDHGAVCAMAGPDALRLWTPVEVRGEEWTSVADFSVREGERVPFVLDWHPSHVSAPDPVDAFHAVARTGRFWEQWSARSSYQGEWREPVLSSLVALKGLTYEPTGGIVAAPTTSLPEALGGVRNWDYRFCWVRDAALTLAAFLRCGYGDEALAFQSWLLRAAAGRPSDLRIMYGIAGERRLPEEELEWLPGYERSAPVRIGNEAVEQFQLDVYGELSDTGYMARVGADSLGITIDPARERVNWRRQRAMLDVVGSAWREPDEGIWEVRGLRRHFTHSKVMAWVAFDRAVRVAERFGRDAPIERWRRLRDEIHGEVCREGYDAERGTFTQYYGSRELDASLLLIPAMGFLPPTDERVRGTVEAVRRELTEDGLVYRYATAAEEGTVDGLPGKEGAFLPCSFWLVDALAATGRVGEARALFERLLSLRNDLGLLSEEYDVDRQRLVGNFPQAFTHLALVGSALKLDAAATPQAPEALPAAGYTGRRQSVSVGAHSRLAV
jgi:GH15 family glucan-1,4-alpha-glucosidase